MPLINRSSSPIYWRIFAPDDQTRAFGIAPAYEGTLVAGGQAGIGYSASRFQIEMRDRQPLSLIPPSRVLVPAGPPGGVGELHRASDLSDASMRCNRLAPIAFRDAHAPARTQSGRRSLPATTAACAWSIRRTSSAAADAFQASPT